MANRRAFMKSGAMAVFATGLGGIPSFITAAAGERKITGTHKAPTRKRARVTQRNP